MIRFPGCYFSEWATDDCWGPMDPAHLVRQQDIKREWFLANPRVPTAWVSATPLTGQDLDALLADRRNIRPACRHHHSLADQGLIAYEVPDSAYAFARGLELDHYLPIREQAA